MKIKGNLSRWVTVAGILLLLLGGVVFSDFRDQQREDYGVQEDSPASQQDPLSRNGEDVSISEDAEETQAERPPLPEKPWISLVIDDFGFSKAMAEEYAALDLPLTWAIIPFQPQSKNSAEKAAEAHIPYIVHMPMAALGDKPWTEKSGVIDKGMSPETVTLLLRKAIKSLPGALGMNNHRGSRATADPATMEMVMNELAAGPLFFLDSRTSSSSVAYGTARKKGMFSAFVSVFLDNETSGESMEKQFNRGLAIAGTRGWVVMIGHTRPDTLNFLRRKNGYRPEQGTFVTLPVLMELLNQKEYPSPAP